MEIPTHECSFMPWITIKEDVRIGPIIFWPFDRNVNSKGLDSEVYKKLKELFECYLNHSMKPIESPTICSFERYNNFSLVEPDQKNILFKAAEAFIFSSVSSDLRNYFFNSSFAPFSTEAFSALTSRFNLKKLNHASWFGYFKRIPTGEEKFFFKIPPSVKDLTTIKPSPWLCNRFNEIFNVPAKAHIFQSLEWFKFAQLRIPEISIFAQIVMMCTAFETLLKSSGRKYRLAKKIDKVCHIKKLKTVVKKSGYNNNVKEYLYSMLGAWAWDFFDIRSKIVHKGIYDGTKLYYLSPSGRNEHQLFISHLVFLECVEQLITSNESILDYLSGRSYSREDLERELKASPEKFHEFKKEIVSRFYSDKIYKTLGWLNSDSES